MQLKPRHVTWQLTPMFAKSMICLIQSNAMKSGWTVTWAADALRDQAPHEVGAVLTPVWPPKCVYLWGGVTADMLTHTQ